MNSWTHFFPATHKAIAYATALLICFSACHRTKLPLSAYHTSVQQNHTLRQGVKGKVLFREGDFLPDGQPGNNARIYGVERTVLVYELTSQRAVELGEGDFLTNVLSEYKDSVRSNEYGVFQISLSPGKYSLFVRENSRIYSRVNEKGYYWPVEVKKDSISLITLEVEYRAKY
jgi:hypothetical protein